MPERFKKQTNKFPLETEKLERGQELTFEEYVYGLKLSPDEMNGKILDVGSDYGDFANEAKKRGYAGVFSVDIVHPLERYDVGDKDVEIGAGKFAVADALKLPFRDETFDTLVSFCSMPHILAADARDRNEFRVLTARALKEMLRVTKKGGEVRLGRVVFTADKWRFDRWEQIQEVLKDIARLKEADVHVETIRWSDFPLHHHAAAESDESTALIRLRKSE